MMKKLFLFIFIFNLVLTVKAQSVLDSEKYVNKSIDGYIHLYYDQQYFLVDENCEYKTYTRVVKFDKSNGGFNGFFTDYFNDGTVCLMGNYISGKKDGNFKGFYPSGKPKFNISFKDDKQIGISEYYYPSGNLSHQIEFKNNKAFLKQYFNNYGQAQIKLGKGEYSFTENATGFNEYGFTAITYDGKVKNGLPQGNWRTVLEYNNNNREFIGAEMYSDGQFQTSNYYFPDRLPSSTSLIKFYPSFKADNATLFTYKNCTIDDNQGFNFYLQNQLNKALSLYVLTEKISSQTYIVTVAVNERGNSTKITFPEDIPSSLKNFTKKTLENINYWIPSFKNRETISDTLKIKIELTIDEKDEPFFAYPSISREKGR
jgi:antitoxin component YwqK of YwqJK toxin-antitoxin module